MTLPRLQELIRISDRLSRSFVPIEFCNRLDSILELIAPFECDAFFTGLGPAAVIISSKPEAVRQHIAQQGIRSSRLFSASSGAVALFSEC
jgi:hypothetical protein